MLVLSRKVGSSIRIGNDIVLTVVKIDRNQVRLGIEAPLDVTILRQELVIDIPEGQELLFEADMVGVPVVRTDTAELSAMGAAHLAGVSSGVFTLDGLRRLDRGGTRFEPGLGDGARSTARAAWRRAVARARSDGSS